MNNNIIISMCMLFIITFHINVFSSYSWHTTTVDNSGSFFGNSIAIDSKGYPHISYFYYRTDRPEKDFKYAYWDGERWNIEVFDSIETYGNMKTSIALDSKDHPYIAYYDYYNISLKCAHFNGQKWNLEYVGAGSFLGYPSITIDKNDNPHIAYNGYKDTYLKYAYWTGSEWHIETIDKDKDILGNVSLALDSKGLPHIAYSDYKLHYIRYAYFDGNIWQTEIIDTNKGDYPSIVIDCHDNIYILYGIYGSNINVICAKWNGNEWRKDVIDTNAYCGSDKSIAIDSYGYPHITYYNNNDILKYSKWDGNKWNIEIVDDKSNVDFCSIAIDVYNNPHIAYDYLQKYAWYGPDNAIDLTSFSAKPGCDAITLNWSVSTDEDISGFNLYRRVATPHTNSNTVRENSYSPTCSPVPVGEIAKSPPNPDNDYIWTKVNTSLITGTNPYSYTDRDIAPDTSYEYKLEAFVSDKAETIGTTECTSGKGTPGSFEIARVYPTPASYHINIDVVIPEQADIDIAIYDITGRKVMAVANGQYSPGEYTLTSDITGLSDGVYIVKMTSEGFSASKNFVVAK